MAKKNVSVRLNESTVRSLQQVGEITGKNLTGVLTEAIARYLGENVDTTASRIERLEKDVADLKNRLRGLAE